MAHMGSGKRVPLHCSFFSRFCCARRERAGRAKSKIKKAFDAQDQSGGGGGFIGMEGFQQVLREGNIDFPPAEIDHLCSPGFIVWSEFWHALLELDKSSGGLKDSSGLMGKKLFDLYHFNGIAKSVSNSMAVGGESPLQKPRLCKLSVVAPPRGHRKSFWPMW